MTGTQLVVDAHVHFWDRAELHYAWLDGVSGLEPAYLPADYPGFTGGTIPPVDAVVVVEANCSPEENLREVAFVDRLADAESRIAALESLKK